MPFFFIGLVIKSLNNQTDLVTIYTHHAQGLVFFLIYAHYAQGLGLCSLYQ
jgi:hypothetical protein